MAKEPIKFTGVSSVNYIKQIFDGSVTHDIAVSKGIKFYNGGKDDSVAVTWDGTQELEVVIPTLADIVANPVVFAGTVDSTGNITWVKGYSGPATGYLVYIQENCTFEGQICEAGDMAVYDGTAWRVISGENQIKLAGTTDDSGNHSVVLSETAAKVIDVEGKALNLSVNYADILGKITADGNGEKTIALKDGKTTISGKYLTLSSSTADSKDITTPVSIDLPTALKSGDVTIPNNVLVSDNFTFTSGSFPTIKKNAADISLNASHNMTIAASGSGSFVTGVTAIKGVSLAEGSETSKDIAYVAGLNAVAGKSFVSGIHVHTAADGDKPVDFTVAGVVTADASVNTFVTGVEDSTSGLVSSINVGKVTGDFVTGLTGAGTSVLTGVTFGDAIEDSTRSWFVTGLEGDAAAVTEVSFGEVVVTPQTSSAIVSASVNNHVLSFNTGNFMTSATAALSGTGVTTKAFTKGGVKLTGFSSTSDTLKTGSVSQAETTISYKSLKTGAVTLTQGTTGFHFDKAESAAYTPVMGYKKLETVNADVVKNGAVLENTAITVKIPSGAVAVDLNAGTLPSLTIANPTGKLSGTVGTELTKVSKDWLAVDPNKKMIAGATTWSLVESSDAAEGSIGFAKAGTYDVSGNTVIEANSFIAAVKVSGKPVPTTPTV